MKQKLAGLLVCIVILSCVNMGAAESVIPYGVSGHYGFTSLSINGQSGSATFMLTLGEDEVLEDAVITIEKKRNGIIVERITCKEDKCDFSKTFSAPTGYSYQAYTNYTIRTISGVREKYVCYSSEYIN